MLGIIEIGSGTVGRSVLTSQMCIWCRFLEKVKHWKIVDGGKGENPWDEKVGISK